MEERKNGHMKSPVFDAVKSEVVFWRQEIDFWSWIERINNKRAYFEAENSVCGRSKS